ncbi:serine/threonine protein kinase [Nannocystis bainbridge]|uniref:Serine/threonine-protein kinase n=1 Tax=Nannocystis bainbridge TaxID=2995303 RepID=A0ABT5E9E7_9BACT|nr:serine/threonine-protein kinase [Nannocystis bainbridge]MDC0722483.1 serine/threonine-protein kinase [Nannocystis bainbridge]
MPAIWHPPKQARDPDLNFHYVEDDDPRENYSDELVGGRYKLNEPIGPGGTSTVYCAEDTRTGGKVAVKILHSSLHERLLGYFGQEGRVASRHSSPYVIQAFDFGCDEGCAFTVFKFVEGMSLQTLARRGPIPWRRMCRIALHVLSGLHELHGAGIIHNDLHASNVMLRHDIADADFAVVIDFGFATVLPSKKITNAPVPDDTVYGLRRYVAPERCAGCPPDPRSDLYALGVLMWEMLTAQTIPDFMVAEPGQIAVPTLAMIAPGLEIPESVDQIVMRALSDVEHRFSDAKEMALALHDALAELPAMVPVIAHPEPGRMPRVMLMGVMLGAMIGGSAVAALSTSGGVELAQDAGALAAYERPQVPELTVSQRSRNGQPALLSPIKMAPSDGSEPAHAPYKSGGATAARVERSETVRQGTVLAGTSKPVVVKTATERRARRGILACDREGKQVKSQVTIEARSGGTPEVKFNGRAAFGDLGDCVARLAEGLGLRSGETLRFRL